MSDRGVVEQTSDDTWRDVREDDERAGYLIVETRTDRPGLVRIRTARQQPELEPRASDDPSRPHIRFVAFFNALQIAGMHAHTALSRRLIDVDAGLYRVDPVTAIAAIEAIDLRHRRVYLDPSLASDPTLAQQIERRSRRLRWRNHIWTFIGILALILLFLFAQIPVF